MRSKVRAYSHQGHGPRADQQAGYISATSDSTTSLAKGGRSIHSGQTQSVAPTRTKGGFRWQSRPSGCFRWQSIVGGSSAGMTLLRLAAACSWSSTAVTKPLAKAMNVSRTENDRRPFSCRKGRERCQRTVSNPPSGIPPTTAQPPHARQCCSATGGKEEKGGRVLPVNGAGGLEGLPSWRGH
jgi:hypothetical protein